MLSEVAMAIRPPDPWTSTVAQIGSAAAPAAEPKRSWTMVERASSVADTKARAVDALLPQGTPPCFDTREVWLDYMRQATTQNRRELQGPVFWLAGTATLNAGFSYCEDCTHRRQAKMMEQHRCDPLWLKRGGKG